MPSIDSTASANFTDTDDNDSSSDESLADD